jgi:hypothetical protein
MKATGFSGFPNGTAKRCTDILMLLAGAKKALLCSLLLATDRALRNGSPISTHPARRPDGDGRPGRMASIYG